MVIQRIQTLMLLIAAILMAIFCCTGFATVGAAEAARTVLVSDAPVLLTLNILIAVLLAADGPYMLDIAIDPEDMVFPMTPVGKPVDYIMLSPTKLYSHD